MSKPKVVRDVIIIVIIIAIAVVLYLNRSSGPVQQDDETGNGGHSQIDHSGMGMMHGGSLPDLADGDPVITLGDSYVGSEWFDASVGRYEMRLTSQGLDEESASREAVGLSVQDAMEHLVRSQVLEEFGIEIGPEAIEEQERQFIGQFDSEEEARDFMDQAGVTIEQQRGLWIKELTDAELISKIAELNSLDPDSQEALNAFNEWFLETMLNSEFVFMDQTIEEFYKEFVAIFDESHGDEEIEEINEETIGEGEAAEMGDSQT